MPFYGMGVSCTDWNIGLVDKKILSDYPYIQFVININSLLITPKTLKEICEKANLKVFS